MKYLSDYTSEKQTRAFDEFGAFFAFSNEQFAAAKKRGDQIRFPWFWHDRARE